MNIKGMQKQSTQQPASMMALDDAEMALSMVDLQNTVSVTYAAPIESYDLLCELQSAASLIMDKAECEALVRELEAARGSHPIAA